jgi:carboxymethylenebutenolidase
MNDMQQYLVDEFVEEYRAGRMTRRDVLRRVTLLTGSAAVAGSLIGAITPVRVAAEPSAVVLQQWTPQVSQYDPAIRAGMVALPADGATLLGYLARPADGAAHPGVMVIHANQGLTAHEEDIVRRYAKAGYTALAIDQLSRVGGVGSYADSAEAMAAYSRLSGEQQVADLNTALGYLAGLPATRADRLGVTGFCAGGGRTWQVILTNPRVTAAVPYYGPIPALDDLSNLQAAVLAIYGGEDPNVNSRIPYMEEAMRAAGKTFEVVIEPGALHAFFNESSDRYNAAAAADAWTRTLAWFGQYLGS